MNGKIKNMVVCALFAAVICVLAPLSVPIGAVPISLGVFAVALAAAVLGWKRGTVAAALYIIIGAVGLPVFSSYRAGVSVLVGVTGGYIWSYVFMALLIGAGADFKTEKKAVKAAALASGMVSALLVCYALGTAQFMIVTGQSLSYALGVCVVPFIPFDAAKLAVAGVLGTAVREALKKAKLL